MKNVNDKIRYLREESGFTLTESIVVLIVMALIAAITVPALIPWYQSYKATERQYDAENIYMSMNNSFTNIKIGGWLGTDETVASADGDTVVARYKYWQEQGSVWTAKRGSAQAWDDGIVAISSDVASADVLDYIQRGTGNTYSTAGFQTITDGQGHYVVELDPFTGYVYGVFYSESKTFSGVEGLALYENAATVRNDQKALGDMSVAYYGGTILGTFDDDDVALQVGYFEFDGEESPTSTAMVYGSDTFTITVRNGKAVSTVPTETTTLNTDPSDPANNIVDTAYGVLVTPAKDGDTWTPNNPNLYDKCYVNDASGKQKVFYRLKTNIITDTYDNPSSGLSYTNNGNLTKWTVRAGGKTYKFNVNQNFAATTSLAENPLTGADVSPLYNLKCYQVRTDEQLQHIGLPYGQSSGSAKYLSGYIFNQTHNIAINGEWTPIGADTDESGTMAGIFASSFNGSVKFIKDDTTRTSQYTVSLGSDFVFSRPAVASTDLFTSENNGNYKYCEGLFAAVSGSINNLTLSIPEKASISPIVSTTAIDESCAYGLVSGAVLNGGSISNAAIVLDNGADLDLRIQEKNITEYNFLGTITGMNQGNIIDPVLNISSSATLSIDGGIYETSAQKGSYTGGLIGGNLSTGSLSGLTILGSGSLTVANDNGYGDTFVGGLIGYAGTAINNLSVDFGSISVNVSATNISNNKAFAGGLAGYADSPLSNIAAAGNYFVSANAESNNAHAGGITGQANGSLVSVSLTAKNGLSVISNVSALGNGLSCAGGIVGSVTSNNVDLTDCSFSADNVNNAIVSAMSLGNNGDSATAGLLAGYLEQGTVSYTDDSIKAVSLSNSIIDVRAYRYASENTLYGNELIETASAGGIIGYVYDETVTSPSIVIENKSILNIGSEMSNANRVGSIIGYHASSDSLSFGTAKDADLSECSIQVLRSEGETAGQRLEQINLYQDTSSTYYVCSGNDSNSTEHNVLDSGPDTAKHSAYLNGLIDITLGSSSTYKQMYPLSYIVTFNGNGTSTEPASPTYQYQLVDYGENASTADITEPIRDGYTFLGWYSDIDHTVPFDFSTAITQDTVIYAGWTATDVTVTFDSRGGTEIPSQILESGEKATKPTNPTRDGYTFDYWYTSDDGGLTEKTQYDFDTPVTKDITLYAKWVPKLYVGYFEFNGTSAYTLYDMYAYRIQNTVGSTINDTLIKNDKAPAENIAYTGYGVLISADVANKWYNSLSSTEKGQYNSTPITVGPYKFYELSSHTATSTTVRGWNESTGSTGTRTTLYLNQNFANAVSRTALTKNFNIRTAEQMQHIGKPYSAANGTTNVASNYLSGYAFTMTHNIKADGDWTPIGITGTTNCSFFQGSFNGSDNGNNYSITIGNGFNFAQCGYQDGGISFNDNSGSITGTRWTKFEGLFAGVGSSSATVSNVRIIVSEDLDTPFGNMSSMPAGDGAAFSLLTAALVNSGTIKGCSIETAKDVTAALILPEFSVQKSNNQLATGASVSVGALVGAIQVGNVIDCSMNLGENSKLIIDNTNVKYSGNDSSVPHSKFAGGIIGCAVASNTTGSSTIGTIGTSGADGFVFGGSGELVISSETPSSASKNDTWNTYAGGVAGYINNNFNVNWKSIDFGNVKIGNSDSNEHIIAKSAAANSYSGGVFGRYDGSISNLSMTASTGQVNIWAMTTGSSSNNNAYAGGFAGYISGSVSSLALNISNNTLWNVSADTSSGIGYMGGLLGYVGGTLTTPKIIVETDSTMNISTSSLYGSSYATNIRSGAIIGYHNATATFGKLSDNDAAIQLVCPDDEKPSQRKETINVYAATNNVLCGNLDLDHNSLVPGVSTGMRNPYLDGLGDPTMIDGTYTYTQLYPMMYTVMFDTNGHGTAPDNRLVDPNDKISATGTDITAEDYIFKGWYTTDSFIDKWVFDTDTVNKSLINDYTFTLHAKWEIDFSDIIVNGFNTVYDGEAHSITVVSSTGKAIDNYQVYSDAACTMPITSFKNVEDSHERVYVKVTRDNENKIYGTDTIIPAVITKKDITVAPISGQSKTYGNTDPTLAYGYSILPTIKNETPKFVGSLSREIGENIGTYNIMQGTLTLANNGLFIANNYELTFIYGIDFTVERKTINVVADNNSKVSGETDPKFTATVTGLVGIDTIVYSLSREDGEEVGAYTITAAGDTEQGNYTIEYSDGTFSIFPLLSYNANGGTGTMTGHGCSSFNEDITVENNTFTAPAGKKFAGWNTKVDGSGTSYAAGDTITVTDNTILYACWVNDTTTITFDKQNGNGGSDTVVATYNEAMPSIIVPTRAGYDFKGYYDQTDGNGTQYYTNTGTSNTNWDKIENTTTLYAYWVSNTYTITYDGNGATAGSTANSIHKLDVPSKLTANGFSKNAYTVSFNTDGGSTLSDMEANAAFLGWSTTSGSGQTPTYKDQQSVINIAAGGETLTLYAQWSSNYAITLPKSTRDGYTINGWYSDSKKTNKVGMPGDTYVVNEDTTLYAKWDSIDAVLKYVANTSSNGQIIGFTSPTSEKLNASSGTAFGSTAIPYTGYHFVSWVDSNGSIVSNTASFKPTRPSGGYINNTTWYANFAANTYTVHYVANAPEGTIVSGSTPNSTFTYGENNHKLQANGYSIPGTSYAFQGWSTSPTGNAIYQDGSSVGDISTGDDIVLYAVWSSEAKLNLISSYADDTTYQTIADKETWSYTQPTRTGWTLDGWVDNSGTKIIDSNGNFIVTSGYISGDTVSINGTTKYLYAKWIYNGVLYKRATEYAINTQYAISAIVDGTEYFLEGNGASQVKATVLNYSEVHLNDDTIGYSFNNTSIANNKLWTASTSGSSAKLKCRNNYLQFSATASLWNDAILDGSTSGWRSDKVWTYANGSLYTNQYVLFKGYYDFGITVDNKLGYASLNKTTNYLYTEMTNAEKTFTDDGFGNVSTINTMDELETATISDTTPLTLNETTSNIETINEEATNDTISSNVLDEEEKQTAESTITFSANGGQGNMNEQVLEHGTAQYLNSNKFVRKGYAFTGWNTKEDGSENVYSDGDYVTLDDNARKNIILYAQWEKAWTISFDANGGDGEIADIQCTETDLQLLPQGGFSKNGSTLTGWNTKKDGTGNSYTINEKIEYGYFDDDTTLYAQWEEEPLLYNLLIIGAKTNTIFAQFSPEENVNIALEIEDGYKIVEISGKDELADFMQKKSRISFIMPKRDVNLIINTEENEPKTKKMPQLID